MYIFVDLSNKVCGNFNCLNNIFKKLIPSEGKKNHISLTEIFTYAPFFVYKIPKLFPGKLWTDYLDNFNKHKSLMLEDWNTTYI